MHIITNIDKAIAYAVEKHAGQLRKGSGMPYIVHPISVMKILMQDKCSEELAMAGVLHDTLEDTSATSNELEDLFGARVLEIVKGGSEPDKSLTWEERKTHTIEFLAKNTDREIALLTCADKLDNLVSTLNFQKDGTCPWGNFKRGKVEQAWYYKNVRNAVKPLVAETRLFNDLSVCINLVFGV